MTNNFGKGIPLSTSFDLGSTLPLDSRSIVETKSGLDALVNENMAYHGLTAFVKNVEGEKDENGNDVGVFYQYTGITTSDGNDFNGWAEIGTLSKVKTLIRFEVTDLENKTNAKLEITANKITSEVNDLKENLTSKIEQTASSITSRVDDLDERLSSEIKQTSDSITSKVEDLDERLSSSIKQTADSITSKVEDLDERLSSEIEQTASSITSRVDDLDERVSSEIEQNADSITSRVDDLDERLSSEIEQTANSLTSKVEDVESGLMSKIEETAEAWTATFNDGYAQGVTTINKDGIKVSQSDYSGYTQMKAQGFFVNNGTEDVVSITKDGAVFKGTMNIINGSVPADIIQGQISDSNFNSTLQNICNRVVDWAYEDSISGLTTIDGGLIHANTIISDKIATGAITADKIEANAITSDKIDTNAITANKINANAVTADKISASAVTANKIDAGAITAEKIATGAITAEKIEANAITADKIKAGAVTADEIAADAVTADKVSAGAITADKIATGAITADKINAGAITADKIASGAITTSKLNIDGELDLKGTFTCYKNANDKTNYLYSSGAMMYGYNETGGSNPVFASGLWTDQNLGYFSVGYTRADVTDANGCLWLSPTHDNTGCRLTYSKLVNSEMLTTNLYFQKDGAIDFITNLCGQNETDDNYTYRFDSGVSTQSFRCNNIRTHNIYPRYTGGCDIGSAYMRYRDIYADSLCTPNNQLRLGTVTSEGAWDQYGGISINSNTGYLYPDRGNGNFSLGMDGLRFSTLYAVNNPNISSDARMKTDIHYLNDEYKPEIIENRSSINMNITTKDMYDFVKDDLKLASYRYKNNLEKNDIHSDYGFIAQDILYTKVGSEIVQMADKEDLDSNLSYNQGTYINTLAGALQVAIKEIEELKKEIQELKNK